MNLWSLLLFILGIAYLGIMAANNKEEVAS